MALLSSGLFSPVWDTDKMEGIKSTTVNPKNGIHVWNKSNTHPGLLSLYSYIKKKNIQFCSSHCIWGYCLVTDIART